MALFSLVEVDPDYGAVKSRKSMSGLWCRVVLYKHIRFMSLCSLVEVNSDYGAV
jgi:hypothetical protein